MLIGPAQFDGSSLKYFLAVCSEFYLFPHIIPRFSMKQSEVVTEYNSSTAKFSHRAGWAPYAMTAAN
jgi:hypothetical protein